MGKLFQFENAVMAVLCALAFCIFAYAGILAQSIVMSGQPFIFRESQTAMAILFADGWAFKDAINPILGSQANPVLEFPLYQQIVAQFRRWGMPMEGSARALSWLSYLITVALLAYYAAKRIDLFQGLLTGALLLSIPLYLYWANTMMIETFALLLSTSFAVILFDWMTRGDDEVLGRSRLRLAAEFGFALIFGVLAALVKITTFLPIAIMLALVGLIRLIQVRGFQADRDALVRRLALLTASGAVVVISMVFAIIWTGYGDSVKATNPMTEFIVSENLRLWNFATLEFRQSFELWSKFPLRIFPEALGYLWQVAIVLAAIGIYLRPKRAMLVGLLCISTLIFVLIFPKLHAVHNYYQSASSLWMVLGVSLAIGAFRERWMSILATIVVMFGMIAQFAVGTTNIGRPYLDVLKSKGKGGLANTGDLIQTITDEDDWIVVLGMDWNPQLLYLAKRRGIAFSDKFGANQPLMREVAAGEHGDVALVADCRRGAESETPTATDYLPLKIIADGRERVDGIEGSCTLYM